MKKPIFHLILVFLIAFSSYSQSIQSIRSNTFENYITKFGKPQKITNKNTFYNSSNTEVREETVTYSKNLDTISEVRYKNSELDANLTFIFDEKGNILFRSFRNKIPLLGWQSETSKYRYDVTGLVEIVNYGSNNNILYRAVIKNDSSGNPVSLHLYDSNNRLQGYETADYDYGNNSYTYKVYGADDVLKTTIKNLIDPEESKTSTYNEQGDVILFARNWNEKDKVFYLLEYKYDDLGNWVEKRIFEVEKNGDQFTKKVKDRKFKRKIKYQS